MSINLLFQKTNSCFVKNKQVEGLNILKNIWVKYPNKPSLFDKINKIIIKKQLTNALIHPCFQFQMVLFLVHRCLSSNYYFFKHKHLILVLFENNA